MSHVVIVIPARYASSRLPGKPLLKETGHYMIEHVYNAASKSKKADEVIVATDDERIYDAVLSFNGRVEMTSSTHQSGTDRLVEVAHKVQSDIYVNVQGDEPEINVSAIDELIDILESSNAPMATLLYPISSEEADNPNIVKAVRDHQNNALYFSRSKIPYNRDNKDNIEYLGHIGMYAYRREFLLQYSQLTPSILEQTEKLEQLRVLENGYKIVTKVTSYRSRGIDTREDYDQFVLRYKSSLK